MKKVLRKIEERRGFVASVQIGPPRLSIESVDGDRINYTVWAFVKPYFDQVPHEGAIMLLHQGRTPDSLPELMQRVKMVHGSKINLVSYEGGKDEYPYNREDTPRYKGPVADDFKGMLTVPMEEV